MRLLLATVLTLIALLVSGCGADAPNQPTNAPADHGKEFDGTVTPHIQVKPGERFSVVLPENASVGDKWELKAPPDQKIAKTEEDDYVSDSGPGNVGGGGKRFFVFTAAQAGDSSIEVYNCFRGCQSEADKQRSLGHTIHLTVAS
jgi:predicted secreted protein